MGVMALFHLQKMFSFRYFFLKKIDLPLCSTSFFAKYLHVAEDGPGRGHLCHTDTFLVFFFNSKPTARGSHILETICACQNYKVACVPSEDLDQPGHLPSLISVFAVRMKKDWVLNHPLSAQRRLIRLGRCPG